MLFPNFYVPSVRLTVVMVFAFPHEFIASRPVKTGSLTNSSDLYELEHAPDEPNTFFIRIFGRMLELFPGRGV